MTTAIEDAHRRLSAQGRDVPAEQFSCYFDREECVAELRESEVETADRLTLLSQVGYWYFEPPVWLQPGDKFWTWGRMLQITSPDGSLRLVEPRPPRQSDVRGHRG